MAWRTTVALLSCLLVPAASSAVPVAEQVTSGNAATRLFGGTDADGGIGDWYISNGIVEAIIDDVGPQADLVGLVGPLAPPKASEAAFTGGSLIDIGTNGANNDQLAQMFTVGGLSTSNFILYDSIGATAGSSSATISATGTLLGFDSGATPVPPANLPAVTEYTVNNGDPYLTIRTTVTNTHPTNAASGLGGVIDAFVWVQRGIVPFSPAPNRGFTHSDLDFNNILASVEIIPYSAGPGNVSPADGIMDPANGTSAGEVSYGLLGDTLSIDQDGPGGAAPTVTTVNTMVGVSSNLITAFGNFPSGSLQPSGILSYTRRVYVGTRNDVASVTNPMITALAARQAYSTGTISGNVDASDTANVAASIIATRVAGGAIPGLPLNSPISQVRTDATGAFSGVVLPVGTYNIEVRSPERDTVNVLGVVVAAAANTPVTIAPLTGLGSLDVSIFERGIPGPGPNPLIPAKLVFKGIAPTPDPKFRRDFDAFALPSMGPPRDIHAESFAGGPAQGNFAYLATGTGTLQLRPGRYEVYAARGPEYTVNKRKIRIKEGITKKLKLRLKRVVDTTDFISGDFHIHSGRSLDSSAPLRDRVASFAGEGVEVMVSTDHDYHVNYAPIIASLGLGNLVTSIVGNEVTTSTPNPPAFPDAIGHINAWPMTVQANERRDGSIEDEFVAPNFLYTRLRNQGAQVVQYNHVRAGVSGLTSIGFFNNFGYDPDLPLTSPPNDLLLDDDVLGPGISGVSNPDGFRNLDFDVLEIGNGTDIPDYLATRRDWFSILNQTDFGTIPFIPATGVSDSHRITLESAGYFRSYVGRSGDNPATLNPTLFNTNIKAGVVMATTGPFIDFSVEESGGSRAGIGQTIAPSNPNVTLSIRVQATNWMPVEEVRVYANGFLALTFDGTTTPAVSPGPTNPRSQSRGRVVRFDAQIPLALAVDTYFVVEAGAKLSPLPTPPVFASMIVPDLVPLGFTNPIFVDLAGDGFDPPGLPVMASLTGAEDLPAFARVQRLDGSMFAQVQGWWHGALASLRNRGAAIAGDEEQEALTGKELQADVERKKDIPTENYFPLYRFSIPQSAIDQAVEQLPEPERSRVRGEQGGDQ